VDALAHTGFNPLPLDEGHGSLSSGVQLFGVRTIRPPAQRLPVTDATSTPSAIWANWSRLSQANLSVETYTRIRNLARYEKEWRGPGSKALTSESLRTFLEFWIDVGPVATSPDLAITARGSIQAEWFRNSRRHLDLEFVGKDKVFFGLFNGNAINEGIDTLEGVAAWLKSHHAKPLLWKNR
jgi:hypothetical protein